MKDNKQMLKESIAEAKVLKETAIANAKLALEETFTPRLKDMFEKKLQEMEEEENDEDLVLENEDEEIVKEEEEEKTEDTEDTKDTEETEPTETTDNDEEINLEDMSEEDLKDFVETVIHDMVETGELEALEPGTEPEKEEEFSVEGGDDEDLGFELEDDELEGEDEEVDVDALIQEIKRNRRNSFRKKRPLHDVKDRGLKLENLKLKSELNKTKFLLESLKSDFKGVNLLNAKLLYSNKIFKQYTLNENQKLKVLNNFDKAEDIKGVKLIYETIISSLDKKQKPIKERMGFASKPIKAPRKLNESQVSDVNQEVISRFKKLAGLDS